jgi:hypothetical protein
MASGYLYGYVSINGSDPNFNAGNYLAYIFWLEDNVDVNANTSRLQVWAYVQHNSSGQSPFGTGLEQFMTFNGNNFSAFPNVYIPANTTQNLIYGTATIPHSSDGSKTVSIYGTGNLGSFGPGSLAWSWTVSGSVALTTIPREAKITNSVNFTVGNTIPLTISNPGNLYVQVQLYTNSTLIDTFNLGQSTGTTLTLTTPQINAIYATIPNQTSAACKFRVLTYSDAGYSVPVGNFQDKDGTVSIDTTANAPTFTTYTLSNVDKNVVVTDKYGDTLITSSTDTLLGSSSKMIKGYSKIRAAIIAANKMVALHSATAVKYRLTAGSKQVEATYSSTLEVDLDLDNVDVNAFTVTAFDSRSLTTAVAGTLSLMSEYTSPVLDAQSLIFDRDNAIEAPVTMSFGGNFWKKYFGSNSVTATGVQNAILSHYHFKTTTQDWMTQNGTFTVTIATPGRITKTAHGFITGDPVHLKTTGALPTGLVVDTTYYVIKDDADHFWLATTKANADAGTKIATTGSQSGTHTVRAGSAWISITPSSDSDGVITFSNYINGDLGASGFTTTKSFDIEVRVYDKLSQVLISGTINRGTPLMDWTQDGVAFGDLYDPTTGGILQANSIDLVIAALLAEKNIIINGDCQVAQRATRTLNTAYGFGSVDMFMAKATGTAVNAGTVNQMATGAHVGISGYALRVQSATITGTGIVFACYVVSSKTAQKLVNKALSFGVDVYHDVGSTINYTIIAKKPTVADNYSSTTTIVTGSAQAVPTATKTRITFENINTGNIGDISNGLQIEIKVECGAITTKNFEFGEFFLNIGTKALDFYPRGFETEYDLCQLFFQKSFQYATAPAQNAGTTGAEILVQIPAGSASANGWTARFPEKMYKTPTVTLFNPSATNAQARWDGGGDCTNTAADSQSEVGFRISYTTHASSSAGNVNRYHWTADAGIVGS